MRVVNLAKRPFVNARPVVRSSIFLWLLGLVLLAVNLSLFLGYWVDSVEVRSELEAVENEIELEEKRFAQLDKDFARLDLADLNTETAFLNRLIEDRTFPWSQLFEDLEDILPRDVKLRALQPNVVSKDKQSRSSRRRGSRRASRQPSTTSETDARTKPQGGEVELDIQGTAKDDLVLMEFVDALYGDASFRNPFLTQEGFEPQSGEVSFNIKTLYRIRFPAPETETEAETPPPGAETAELPSSAEAGLTPEPSGEETVEAGQEPGDEPRDGPGHEASGEPDEVRIDDDEALTDERVERITRVLAESAPAASPRQPVRTSRAVPSPPASEPRSLGTAAGAVMTAPASAPPSGTAQPSTTRPSTTRPGPTRLEASPGASDPEPDPPAAERPSSPATRPINSGSSASGTPRLQQDPAGGSK